MPSITAEVSRSAGFSRCKQFRYWLGRQWDPDLPNCVFIGLNPSTADANRDDPTIRRIMGFAHSWGYGGVTVINLFAFRATLPRDLRQAEDPVGPRNNHWIRKLCRDAPLVIAAWGNDGTFQRRDQYVLKHIAGLQCLGETASGCPRHPLYTRADTLTRTLGAGKAIA